MNNNFIQSPLNYTGGKYKLLKQIIPLFPNNIDIFVDLFGGGCNVGANVKANTIVYNELDTNVFNIVKGIYESDNNIINIIDSIIQQYNLSKTNKEGYLKLRNDWNKSEDKDWIRLYTLILHSFNNSIRFNSKGEFNIAFGKDRSDFNPKLKDKFKNFRELIKSKNFYFYNKSFEELTKSSKCNERYMFYCVPKDTFVYQNGKYKPVQDIIEGNTDLGNGNICLKKHRRYTENEEILRFNIMGISRHFDLRVSKNHVIFTYDKTSKQIVEKRAEDITTDDYLVIDYDRNIKTYIPEYSPYSSRSFKDIKIDYSKKKELALLLGLFMAEGHLQNGLCFSYNVTESYYHTLTVNLIKEIFGVQAKICERSPHNTVTQVKVFSNEIMYYFLEFYEGKTARFKKLKEFVMKWDSSLQLYILKGWLYGDGGYRGITEVNNNRKFIRTDNRNKYQITGTTTSFELATQMYNIALRCGLHPNIKKRVTKHNVPLKDGRVESITYDVYFTMKKDVEKILSLEIKGRNCGRRFHNEDGYLITRINKITKELYTGEMYDLTTTQGNFWTFGNVKVHNCDPPYLVTTATYNEKNGWTEDMERLLYSELDKLNSKGCKFALSNVIEHKGRSNNILKEWMKKYNVHYLNYNYNNCNYQSKNTDKPTIEILVTNY